MIKKVLIVDDNAGDRVLIKEILSEIPLIEEFQEAESGEEAIEAVKSFRPHLVLLDINLTGIDGYETCQKIKELDDKVKVILLTGYSEYFDREKRVETKADLFTLKRLNKFTLRSAYIKLNDELESNDGKKT
ncbi:MAG: response regulator transcription factor [Candidatus Omnitrophota bacterium]